MFICQSLRKLWCRNITDHVKETLHGLTPSRTIFIYIYVLVYLLKKELLNSTRLVLEDKVTFVWSE